MAWSVFDGDFTVVKMSDNFGETAKRLDKCQLHLHQQIISAALEHWVVLLVEDDNDITGRQARRLIALTIKCDLLSVIHALVDVNLKHFPLGNHLLARARLAAIFLLDCLAGAVAVAAVALNLLDHAWAKLTVLDLHALAAAFLACGHGAVLAALAITPSADDILLDCELGDLTHVQVLEADLQLVHHVLALALTLASSTAASEHHVKDVGWHSALAGSLLEALLTDAVVQRALLGV